MDGRVVTDHLTAGRFHGNKAAKQSRSINWLYWGGGVRPVVFNYPPHPPGLEGGPTYPSALLDTVTRGLKRERATGTTGGAESRPAPL